MNTNPPSTAAATCSVVAFWPGTSLRDSWISSCEPVHQALRPWPISRTPSSSMPPVISSDMILNVGWSWKLRMVSS